MHVLLIHHFFHPDTVVSARVFADLAEDLVRAGHTVTVYTSNRLYNSQKLSSGGETWRGVSVRRFARPGFDQHKKLGRLLNSLLLQLKWLRAFRKEGKSFDAVILGTDPQFGYFMFPWMRRLHRRVKRIYWAFDLYPEAIFAGAGFFAKLLAALTQPWAHWSYRAMDGVVDIGSCMRRRLERYHAPKYRATLTPWALAEPAELPEPNPEIRRKLFGNAKLALLYSGSVGQAHDLRPIIELARRCREEKLDVSFCIAGYGNCYEAQTALLTEEDANVRLAPFASEKELELRLAAADLHLVALRPAWEGVAVPSKFFGSLAMGRPVIYSTSPESAIAQWSEKHQVGFALTENSTALLKSLIEDPAQLQELQLRAFQTYQKHFSREVVTQGWLNFLSAVTGK